MLQYIIKYHLELFSELFPNERVKPKQHYLIHYPRCIRMVGPLVRFWAMRFEAKHNFFRRLSHIVCNFKNICKTIAYRHQYAQCYRFYKNSSLNDGTLVIGKGSVTLLANNTGCKEIKKACGGSVGLYEDIYVAKWIKVHGTLYKPSMFLFVDVDTDGSLPIFAKILNIIVVCEQAYFVVDVAKTKFFSQHLNAYAVKSPTCEETQIKCVVAQDLRDFHPFHLKRSLAVDDAETYIVMRHQPWY